MVAAKKPVTTGSSIARGWRTTVESGGSSLVFGDVSAGSRGRAAVNEGPQLPSQQGIGTLMAFSLTSAMQHDEHNADNGAARRAAPMDTRTA
jgi:hypothetical protein